MASKNMPLPRLDDDAEEGDILSLFERPGPQELLQQLLEAQRWLQEQMALLTPEQRAQFEALREKMDRFGDSDLLDA